MKLLLALMLFVSVAGAQTKEPERRWSSADWMYRLDTLDNLQINRNAALTLSSVLYFYSRFEKECWADSTLIRIPIPCPEKRIGCLVNHGETDYWTHREPTFRGFIQWMRKQR